MSGRSHENPKISINRKYVSRKISSVRWKPSSSLNDKANIFVTGSWDDEENNLSVWHLRDFEGEPSLLQEIPQCHDVNDIQYITRDLLAIGTGNGSIQLYEHNQSNCLESKQLWDKCHTLKSGPVSCTSLASNGEQIASVGEDGKIFVFNPEERKAIKTIDTDSECSEYAIVFVKAAEILTGNMQGHLKLWDLRAQSPLKATMLSPDQVSVKHLCGHPTQQHLIAAAEEDGTLALWDMRLTSQPLVLIAAHTGPMSEIQFHPTASEHLFSCGTDGKVLHWDASSSYKPHLINTSKHIKDPEDVDRKGGLTNVWFSDDVKQGMVDAISLIPTSRLPINSLTIDSETLLAGSDNETLYIMKNVLHE